MLIRAETNRDYAAVADLHVRAFGERVAEALIVPLLRERADFAPELSLVAEINGQIAGHALFSPYTVRLLGQEVRAVNLAPLGVNPVYQRQGVGGALLRQGHEIARAQGYAFSLLLGHTSYYPRFGYQTRAFGASSIAITPTVETPLETRPLREADVPALGRLWLREEGEVDFALTPGDRLIQWLSPNPQIQTAVYVREGEIVGYTRIYSPEPYSPRVFLAADTDAARRMVAMIAGKTRSTVTLPLHPRSASAAVFGTPHADAWDAAMACPLNDSPLDEYLAQVEQGQRPPGRPVWPSAFDLA